MSWSFLAQKTDVVLWYEKWSRSAEPQPHFRGPLTTRDNSDQPDFLKVSASVKKANQVANVWKKNKTDRRTNIRKSSKRISPKNAQRARKRSTVASTKTTEKTEINLKKKTEEIQFHQTTEYEIE